MNQLWRSLMKWEAVVVEPEAGAGAGAGPADEEVELAGGVRV